MSLHLQHEHQYRLRRPSAPCRPGAVKTVGMSVMEEAQKRLREEAARGGTRGVLITWHGYGSYVIELSEEIPLGIIYERIA